jgi:hypothetical protein
MSRRKHHVHANIRSLGTESRGLFAAARFMLDPFVDIEISYAPPIHYSLECDDAGEANAAWRTAVAITQADPDFEGYVEFETLSKRFSAPVVSKPYEPDRAFPLPSFQLSEVPLQKHKRADLHVKRTAGRARDQLDLDLTRAGFYEVHTERNRIYTLQCENAGDARRIFLLLKKFLTISGGAEQVNFEVISKFLRKPLDLRLPKYLPKQHPGCLENLDIW